VRVELIGTKINWRPTGVLVAVDVDERKNHKLNGSFAVKSARPIISSTYF